MKYPALIGWFFLFVVTLFHQWMDNDIRAISSALLSISFLLLLIAGNQK